MHSFDDKEKKSFNNGRSYEREHGHVLRDMPKTDRYCTLKKKNYNGFEFEYECLLDPEMHVFGDKNNQDPVKFQKEYQEAKKNPNVIVVNCGDKKIATIRKLHVKK